MPGNLGIVDEHFFSVTHDDQRQVCLCWSYGSRTYHDNQSELIHERWPNQSIETLGCPWRNLAVLASGQVVQWMGRLGEEQQPQLHRCLHHPDLLRVDALDPDQAKTLSGGEKITRCSHDNQLRVSYRDFFLTNPVWTSFCGSTTSTRHTLSFLCTKTSRELNSKSTLKHLQGLLCVTSCYFVTFFFETVN